MEKISTLEQFNELTSTDQEVIVKFYTGWCPDCTFIDPFMPEIEEKFSAFTFVKVDRDDFIDVCASLDVFGIPSFVEIDGGEEIGRYVNRDRKTQKQIETFIEKLV